jgi:hypothetical protein
LGNLDGNFVEVIEHHVMLQSVGERNAAHETSRGNDKWEATKANAYIYELATALRLIRVYEEKHVPQASAQ